MHEYLDDDISSNNEKILREHLTTCSDCHAYFQQLKETISLIQSTSQIKAPENFTASVMLNLPKTKKKEGFKNWMKIHPFLTAASLFIVLMTGSLFSTWQNDHKFSVSNQSNLVVKNNKVIVPEGKVVKGDVVVKNGELSIEGEVQGDVTVINGEHYLASAGHVTGEIKEVNKVFEWLWYQIKDTSKKISSVFSNKED
jgi:anti-sigma factor RsiW